MPRGKIKKYHEAALAYDKAANKPRGESATLNLPHLEHPQEFFDFKPPHSSVDANLQTTWQNLAAADNNTQKQQPGKQICEEAEAETKPVFTSLAGRNMKIENYELKSEHFACKVDNNSSLLSPSSPYHLSSDFVVLHQYLFFPSWISMIPTGKTRWRILDLRNTLLGRLIGQHSTSDFGSSSSESDVSFLDFNDSKWENEMENFGWRNTLLRRLIWKPLYES
ncbi:Ethylene-responsive transcription factor [Melia azedarach]|uniref:Ethylene-responsive transcription factor n=1 Tax=Melia azedarach TaxID=155640 RepID=A0ACC1XX66_MELAZ|nr:Ethylene-responsive transcription factor [Melia azedarach]